ncbi:MAG: hypothetical protein AB8B50_17280 [Pirellulaceae bacterium]
MNSIYFDRNLRARRGVVLICVLVCLLVATTLIVLSATSALRSRREALAYHQRVQLEQLLGSAAKRAQVAVAEQGADYAGESWTFGEQDVATPNCESADLSITVLSQTGSQLLLQVTAALLVKSDEKTGQSRASLNPPVQKRTIELSLPVGESKASKD